MSQSEGPAPGGAAPARPAAARASAPPSWEDTFAALSTPDQQSLLELAARQGYLLAEQVAGESAPPADAVRPVIQRALAGQLPSIPLCEPVTRQDAALDAAQCDAVARALATPDLFVVRGPTGTGKSRVATEIVRQAVGRGGRVLFLSPVPAALDAVLPALDDLAVIRRLGQGESADRLPPALACLVPGRREAVIRTTLARRSAEALSAAEERARQADQLQSTWRSLAAVRERRASRAAERAILAQRRDRITGDVRHEADSADEPAPFHIQRLRRTTVAHAKRVAALDGTSAEIAVARAETDGRRRAAEAIIQELKPKAEALDAGRWYSLTFWRAKADGALAERLAKAESDRAAAVESLSEIAVREQKLAADRQLADEEYQSDRARFLDAEIAGRQAELDARIADLDREIAADAAREAELSGPFRKAGVDTPDAASIVAEADAARRELEFARGWANEVRCRTDDLVREACTAFQVVAGPVAGIDADPTAAAGAAPFDLLVVDDADRLTEADFYTAARLARRWVLIGEPADVPTGRQRLPKPDLFARLVAALRHDIWVHDGPRLVCRLTPVRGADRRRLECEPVADAPHIELRLFTPPDGDPTLAEVAFPGDTPPAIAREYLVRELGEVTCESHTRVGAWEQSSAGPVLRFAPADPAAAFADLGSGIREELVGLETRALRFPADWPPDRARAWASDHVGRRAGGRLATLARPYRACPGLARWLNRAFDTGFACGTHGDEGPHVEFLAVPDSDLRRRHGHSHGRPGRVGGAGYELDLADPRQRATLPPDLADLPAAGLVNLPEAHALVRYIEPLAGAGLAVTSPFPAQVAVLRKLLARSPRLAQVPVLEATDAAGHECNLLAISLTRSHVARAVPFGDGPHLLAGLLGRARKRVLFAGDPGTLARRLQWEGPVDHLDAAAAARERAWVAALADCPRVTGPRSRPVPPNNVRA
jgi:hypothetical protein